MQRHLQQELDLEKKMQAIMLKLDKQQIQNMNQIFTWIWVSSGILLILLVLLHSPKGDGMGGIAASGSSMFTSASSAEASLNKITWTVLIIFLSLAIILSAGWI